MQLKPTPLIRSARRGRRQQGFSLLEVLISIVVVAIGLLGVAGLQVAAIKLADTAQIRTSGAALVSNITERIRSNSSKASSYALSYGVVPTSATTQAEQDLSQWRAAIAALPPRTAQRRPTRRPQRAMRPRPAARATARIAPARRTSA